MLLALPLRSHSQEPASRPKVLVSPLGVEIFARLVDQAGLVPVQSLKQLDGEVPPSKCVVIVLGSAKPLDQMSEKGLDYAKLVRNGASLFIATDRVLNLKWADADVNIRPATMANYQPNSTFEDRPLCPWIHPLPRWPHPIFRDVDKPIASNCPAEFRHFLGDLHTLHPVAWLPPLDRTRRKATA